MSRNMNNRRIPAGNAGFSLLELVIYIATASIALLGVISLFTLLGNSWVRVQARARVEEGARLAIERIRYEVEQSQGILSPIPGGTGDVLMVDAGGTSRDYSGQAWSESLGWIYFGCDDATADAITVDDCVQVNDTLTDFKVTRFFDSLSGFAVTEGNDAFAMSCVDSPNDNPCRTGEYLVTVDASGDYHGFAYGQDIGWLSFNCENTASCLGTGTTSNPCGGDEGAWRVCEIWDSVNGYELHGWAWSNQVGWISFNCENENTEAACDTLGAPYDYAVTSRLAGSELAFTVNSDGKLVAQEGSGVEQPLTDDDILISYCDGETVYFRNIANSAPARAAAQICFKATYSGAGVALTDYSTEVRTTFELN